RHARLGDLFLLHGLGQLPCYDLFDGLRLCFFKDVFLLQEVVNARSQILLTHLVLFFLAANSGGSSPPSTGGFPFPTRFRMRAILAGSARRARAVKYSSVRNTELLLLTTLFLRYILYISKAEGRSAELRALPIPQSDRRLFSSQTSCVPHHRPLTARRRQWRSTCSRVEVCPSPRRPSKPLRPH